MTFLKSLLIAAALSSLGSAAPVAPVKRINYPNPYIADAPSYAALPQPTGGEHMRTTPTVKSSEFTDQMHFVDSSGNSVDVKADLGYSGVIGGKSFWIFGDTFVGSTPEAVDASGHGDLNHPALMTIHETGPNYVKQLIVNTADEDATNKADGGNMGFGGTNIVETSHNEGVIFYEKIQRVNSNQNIIGAGVATITINDDGTVQSDSRSGETFWNNNEPFWGDIGATKDSTHIYLWGHGPPSDNLEHYGFLARVPIGWQTNIDSYEYFDNSTQSWTSQRFTTDGDHGTRQLKPEMAVWGKMEMFQAAPFWNAWYGTYMWLYGPAMPTSNIMLATADSLQGPWTKHGEVAQTQGYTGEHYLYGINGHPEYDPTGKTSYVTWVVDNTVYGSILSWN